MDSLGLVLLPKFTTCFEEGGGDILCLSEQFKVSFGLMTQWSSNVALESFWITHQACQSSDVYQWRGHTMLIYINTVGPSHAVRPG